MHTPSHVIILRLLGAVINKVICLSAFTFQTCLCTDPEGLEGWRPEDFQRPRPGMGRGLGPRRPLNPDIDPDIGQPGPGRGADWDSMFG
jgi:hypothetical protein